METNVAVYVADVAGAVIAREALVEPFSHCVKEYCVPMPLCGVVTLTVQLAPVVHCTVAGVV